MALALANLLFFCLCAGVFVSARSNMESRALAGTIGIIACCMAIPELFPATPFVCVSPLRPWMMAHELAYNASPVWILAASVVQPGRKLVAVEAGRHGRFAGVGEKNRADALKLLFKIGNLARYIPEAPARRRRLRVKLLDINPVLWLASRSAFGSRRWPWCFVWIWVIACVMTHIGAPQYEEWTLAAIALLTNFVLKMQYGAEACRLTFAEIRRNQGLGK